MDWQADMLPALFLATAFLLLLGASEVWARVWQPSPEWPRKLVHLGGGMICLVFPFVLESPWTVAVLAAGMTTLFVAGKHYSFLKSVHGVERKSKGVEFYPAMVFALFWLGHQRPWLYAASLLALAVADALAALVGSRFGRWKYEVDEDLKTVEGSLTFLLAAFGAIAIPLLLSNDPTLPARAHRVTVAVVAAVLVTLFEAVSRHGRDNLWVPLGTFLVLSRLIGESLVVAYVQLASFAVVCLVLAFVSLASRAVNVGATLALILTVYGCWALTSIDWVIPLFGAILLCFVVANWFPPQLPLRLAAILHMVLPGVLAAAAADLSTVLDWQPRILYSTLYAAFLGCCLVIVAQNVWAGVTRGERLGCMASFTYSVAVSAVVSGTMTVPLWMRDIGITGRWWAMLFALALIVCWTHGYLFGGHRPSIQRQPFVARRYFTVLTAMFFCATAQYLGIMPSLTPH